MGQVFWESDGSGASLHTPKTTWCGLCWISKGLERGKDRLDGILVWCNDRNMTKVLKVETDDQPDRDKWVWVRAWKGSKKACKGSGNQFKNRCTTLNVNERGIRRWVNIQRGGQWGPSGASLIVPDRPRHEARSSDDWGAKLSGHVSALGLGA